MNTEVLFSSKSELWSTPQDLFDELNKEFHFNLDPCATSENAKCAEFFTKEQDGLQKNWGGYNVFCNPPYGRTIGKWIQKAYQESQKPETLVVCLVPARTDTRWFHDYVLGKAEIRFIKGRLKFSNYEKLAPFPSMLIIYRKEREI